MIWFSIIALFMLSACSSKVAETARPLPTEIKQEQQEEKKIAGAQIESSDPITGLTFQIKGAAEIFGVYNVTLSWSCDENNETIYDIYRIEQDLKLTELVGTVHCNELVHSHTAAHHQEFTYTFRNREQDLDEAPPEIKISTPLDVQVDGTEFWNSELKPNRLFLMTGATLFTGEQNIDLNLEELVSDHAKIISFSENSKARLMQNGRSSGSLFIHAAKAIGSISIQLNGEHGGDGQSGNAGFAGSEGATGVLGRAGNLYCFNEPGDGATGSDGLDGENGADGADGGNAGGIHVEVLEKHSNFEINITNEPGRGGQGGAPGIGGAGGRGGKAGGVSPNSFNTCLKKVVQGQPGKNGKNGLFGKQGRSGVKKNRCAIIENVERGDCAIAARL